MSGDLILKKRITRDYVLSTVQNQSSLFLFGDNMERRGFGGQAAAMRDCPYTLGVPTKWKPSMDEVAFFTNSDYKKIEPFIIFPFELALAWLDTGNNVFMSADGIGTGLSKLQEKAPNIFTLIEEYQRTLEQLASTVVFKE